MVQDERIEMHYGVQDRMSASSRDEKEEKHVLKYVGDPVFSSSRVKRESRFTRRCVGC